MTKEVLPENQVTSGGLNQLKVFDMLTNSGISRYIVRFPKDLIERENTIRSIQQEYEAIGLSQAGATFRLRSVKEQAHLIDTLKHSDLCTIDYLEYDEESIRLPYIEGVLLSQYLRTAGNDGDYPVIQNIITNLVSAHKQGIVMGDRWCPNTFILPDGKFIEFDYDIELVGEQRIICAFEFAQLIYHLLHFAGECRSNLAKYLSNFLTEQAELLSIYDLNQVNFFLTGHARFFGARFKKDGQLYEGLRAPSLEELNPLMKIFQETNQSDD